MTLPSDNLMFSFFFTIALFALFSPNSFDDESANVASDIATD